MREGSRYSDLVDELQEAAADVDDRPAAHLLLAAGGLEMTDDVDEPLWPVIFDDVEYHLGEAERRITNSEALYEVRKVHSVVRGARNLGRSELRRGRDV